MQSWTSRRTAGRAAVPGVAVEDYRERDGPGDVAAELDALRGGEDARVREGGVVAAGDARAHERRLAAGGLHDLGVEGVGRAQHGQHAVVASQKRPEPGGRPRRRAIRHEPEPGRPARA